jgi:tripartite-type tricarboxylate transporter receptor subunit TctC
MVMRLLLAIAGLALAAQANAQTYPARPVKIVVSFAAGGIADSTGRLIANELTGALGKPFIVENRPGNAALVGITMVAKAPPDGYTLLLANTNVSTNQALYKDLNYDADRDLIPVANAVITPAVLVVHPSVPATTVKEFIALAKTKPGQINYASVGLGSFPHLAMEMFDQMAGTKLTHIPYKGFAPAVTAVLSGEVEILASDVPTALQHIETGKLRALGATGTKRFPVLPDLPTVAESALPDYEAAGWLGIMAPAGTPRDIVVLLNTEINRAMSKPETIRHYVSQGSEIASGTPEDFSKFLQRNRERWKTVIATGNIHAE